MEPFWKSALKSSPIVTIIVYVLYKLLSLILGDESFINNNPIIILIICVCIIIFSTIIISINRNQGFSKIKKNKISNNTIGRDLKLKSKTIEENDIVDNEIEQDLIIEE